MNEQPVIELEDVSYSYGAVPALADICFRVKDREFLCIVGPNGGGKTTLLKLILGLLAPDQGRVRVFGQPPVQARNRIGYMPQNQQHDPQFPITVLAVVLMGRLHGRVFGAYSRRDKAAAMQALEAVEMAGSARQPYASLSGGQRQRVLIARALSTEPDMLILDEPTANVDPEQERRLQDVLQRLKGRMTILMVTHDFVSDMVEQVVCINRGIEIHPTTRVEGHGLADIYGRPGRIVRHDQKVDGAG